MKQPSPSRDARAAANEMVAMLDSPFLRALTDASRLEVLRVLMLEGTSNIATLAEQLPQDRSVISRHLKALEDAGIVRSEWRGRERWFSLNGERFVSTLESIAAKAREQLARCCPPSDAVVPAATLRKKR
ncbi:MAG: winged helix-turn-helix transcriptional regulator [Myxococcales bacterium]|nr:winged helix-turn-helix transcriptional regulator [Myxococcales bacterium]